jgi:four helix bundle protein
MSNFRNLRVYHAALAQIHAIAQLTGTVQFGDLANQLRRAAISVASNLAEGAERGSTREFIRFTRIARASNAEVAAQLDIIAALGGGVPTSAALAANASIGRQLSGLIRSLRDSGG